MQPPSLHTAQPSVHEVGMLQTPKSLSLPFRPYLSSCRHGGSQLSLFLSPIPYPNTPVFYKDIQTVTNSNTNSKLTANPTRAALRGAEMKLSLRSRHAVVQPCVPAQLS